MARIEPQGKQGILFTVSSMLLSLCLLTFAFYLSEQSARARQSAVTLAEIDRTTDTYANVEDQLIRIISASTNISAFNGTVVISEALPLRAQTQADLDRFAQFETQYADLNVSMELSSLKEGAYLIQPGDTEVTHADGFFRITPMDTGHGAGSLEFYQVNITFPAMGVDSAEWQSIAAPNSSWSALAAGVRVQDASYAINLDFSESVDKYGNSTLVLKQGGLQVGYVKFLAPAALEVSYTGNIGLKTSVGFSHPIFVEADDEIRIGSYANKTGRVRIA